MTLGYRTFHPRADHSLRTEDAGGDKHRATKGFRCVGPGPQEAHLAGGSNTVRLRHIRLQRPKPSSGGLRGEVHSKFCKKGARKQHDWNAGGVHGNDNLKDVSSGTPDARAANTHTKQGKSEVTDDDTPTGRHGQTLHQL